MKRAFKYFFITLLSVISILCITIILSVTVFRDELINLASKMATEEVQTYYISDIPVGVEQFAEDFDSIHKQVV